MNRSAALSASRHAVAVGLLVAHAATPLPAQESSGRFGEVVDVELVNVEVWVTDSEGRPVRGLDKSDFEVREDGKPVEITHFAEIIQGRERSPLGITAEPAGAEGTAAGEQFEPPHHLVLYFDDLHLGTANRRRLVDDLREFLAAGHLAPQQVMILRQTRDLYTEAAFGADFNRLDDALSRLAELRPLGVETAQNKRLAVTELQDLWEEARSQPSGEPCRWFLPRAIPAIELYARYSETRIQVTLDHLAATAAFLAALPGVKTLLYLSDALETSPGTDLLSYVNGVCPAGHREMHAFVTPEGLSEPFQRLTRHANTNRVTIYALQAHGLKTSFTRSAESRTLDFLGANPLATAVRTHERDGLAFLASQTGGRAVFNRNAFGPELAAIGDEIGSYYSLAYEPPHGGDGGEHKIEVKLEARGLRARHRRSYRDKDPEEELEERLESAIHLGLMSNPLAARLGAGNLEETGEDRYLLSLHVLVPVERVAFLPGEGGEMARLMVRVLGRNAANRRVADDLRFFDVARPPESAETLDLLVPLQLRGGPLVLAVGVRDEATRETSYLSTSLEIQDPAGR